MNDRICRKFVLAIFCPVAVMMLAATLLVNNSEKLQPRTPLISAAEIASVEESEAVVPQPPFTVGSWQGHVAVFESEHEAPVMVLETSVASLPEADQIALAEGIAVYDQQMLASLLEDYGS